MQDNALHFNTHPLIRSTNGSSSSTTTKPVPIPEAKATGSGSGTGASGPGTGTGVAPSGEGSTGTGTTTPTTASTLATVKHTEGSAGIPTTATTPSAPATPSTPKIHTEWLSDELLAGVGVGGGVSPEGEKAPFTLENANKEDELRRAETEHRSRKSKVLSAEYKHINRYINFSSDTKSLLTRSASAAPSISSGSGFYDGPGDQESNISSEALAIQVGFLPQSLLPLKY